MVATLASAQTAVEVIATLQSNRGASCAQVLESGDEHQFSINQMLKSQSAWV